MKCVVFSAVLEIKTKTTREKWNNASNYLNRLEKNFSFWKWNKYLNRIIRGEKIRKRTSISVFWLKLNCNDKNRGKTKLYIIFTANFLWGYGALQTGWTARATYSHYNHIHTIHYRYAGGRAILWSEGCFHLMRSLNNPTWPPLSIRADTRHAMSCRCGASANNYWENRKVSSGYFE